jgi:hypothetical protein
VFHVAAREPGAEAAAVAGAGDAVGAPVSRDEAAEDAGLQGADAGELVPDQCGGRLPELVGELMLIEILDGLRRDVDGLGLHAAYRDRDSSVSRTALSHELFPSCGVFLAEKFRNELKRGCVPRMEAYLDRGDHVRGVQAAVLGVLRSQSFGEEVAPRPSSTSHGLKLDSPTRHPASSRDVQPKVRGPLVGECLAAGAS